MGAHAQGAHPGHGGTIAGQAPSQTDESYRPGQVGVDRLIGAVRDLQRLAEVSGEQVAQIASQDMNDARWLQIAARVNALFGAGEADGIVVTHGTDSMEETAYFLHLVVRSDRPVVLTGAMRPASSLSPDGPLNLYNAVAVAADPEARGRGAIVVLNDDLHSARDVTKSHTSDVQAFVSPGPGLLGTATYGAHSLLSPTVAASHHELGVRDRGPQRPAPGRHPVRTRRACRRTWWRPASSGGREAWSWRAWATAT